MSGPFSNHTNHITKLYKPGTTQVCEIRQAKRLRDMIAGEWDSAGAVPGLEKAERETLLSILDQWIEILEDEVGEA